MRTIGEYGHRNNEYMRFFFAMRNQTYASKKNGRHSVNFQNGRHQK